ncbi:MAG: hypothetical protein FWC76_08520 [Defluviitaleaceae bacterium]|nr:hypothetical protein [Defluviitaleaceae bacterium]
MMNIKDVPEPFREFLSTGQKQQEISAASIGIDTELGAERGRTDMQDVLFLAAILLLCDD